MKDVNDAGGIMLKSIGKKMKIEVIEYDDRSNSEEMIKAVERLATQDKVDFILPPWSTGMNLAAAPIFNKLGYPQLAVTANTNQAPRAHQALAEPDLLARPAVGDRRRHRRDASASCRRKARSARRSR